MSPIPLAGGLAVLLALPAVGACAAPSSAPSSAAGPAASPATAEATAEADTADVSVIREPGGGAVVFVSFRAESPVAISSEHALRVETPTGRFEAALGGAPQRAMEGVTAVSSAEYRLAEAGVRALDAAGGRARVAVHDGEAYRTYAVRRVDFLE